MGDLEGVGEAVTGGAVSRAVEPTAGEAPDGHTREGSCLNCGTPLSGPYCHACGQQAHVHRTLSAFFHDLLHGALHFEGKIWRTLPLLAWKPGELTRRYVDGQRARFVSPIALFLFSVFLMFAVFSLVGGPVVTERPEATAQDRAEAQAEFNRERQESLVQLKALQDERARLVAAGQPTADVDRDIQRQRAEIALEDRLFRQTMDLVAAEEKRNAADAEDGEQKQVGGTAPTTAEGGNQSEAVIIAGADSLNAWFKQAYRKAKENPTLLVYKMQTAAYKFSWLLIPISVPFVWLLFLHRRRYRREFKAYDHLIFVTYSIAFMSLALIALSLLRPIGLPEGAAILLMMLVPPVHIYRQLKGAYGLSRFSALWRTVVLITFTLVALTIFGAILLLLGVLG